MMDKRPDDTRPRRQLIGSWLDWIDSAVQNQNVPPHHLDRDMVLTTILDLRSCVAEFGPDSTVSHRAQAAFLVAVKPEVLFELLNVMAVECARADEEESA
jgi:hypothetical protein